MKRASKHTPTQTNSKIDRWKNCAARGNQLFKQEHLSVNVLWVLSCIRISISEFKSTTFFFLSPLSINVHGQVKLPIRNEQRHLVSLCGWCLQMSNQKMKRWKEQRQRRLQSHVQTARCWHRRLHHLKLKLSVSLSGPKPGKQMHTSKSSSRQTHSTEHLGSIASRDCSQKHLYPPCSLYLLSVSLYSC